jgi:nucleoside-diphosphate-sugar epimerase
MTRTPRLFCFGLGYSARALARALFAEGWPVAGTSRGDGGLAAIEALGAAPYRFAPDRPLEDAAAALSGTTHLLSAVPPSGNGDAVVKAHRADIARLEALEWIGYLSSTGVYGDRGGGTVDEAVALAPESTRARRRAKAEALWAQMWRIDSLPVHIFRLSGIYGPGRSALDQVRAGTARRIDKPGQAFSRIHVDDLVAVLRASIERPRPGAIYNVSDDEPATSAEVVAFACELLGVEPPPLVPFAHAVQAMSPMAREFWSDNRRVSNALIHDELGVALAFPSYREGLRAILAAEG